MRVLGRAGHRECNKHVPQCRFARGLLVAAVWPCSNVFVSKAKNETKSLQIQDD